MSDLIDYIKAHKDLPEDFPKHVYDFYTEYHREEDMNEPITISSPGINPSNSGPNVFPNYAGRADADDEIEQELVTAGIRVERAPAFMRDNREVKTIILGSMHRWGFHRNWYYWVASGPGIPPEYANKLHEEFGNEVRVDGHCGCPSPFEQFKGFSVGSYHVDTQRGLNALADTLRKVYNDAQE